MTKFCTNCGQNISDKVKFCPECGTNLNSLSQSIETNNTKERNFQESSNNFPTQVNGGKKLYGVVSNFMMTSSTHGSIGTNTNGNVSGNVSTNHTTTFRVNNFPCWWDGPLNISNGDNVTVAGEGSGELHVYALHNMSTSIVYSKIGPSAYTPIFLFLLGVAFAYLPVSYQIHKMMINDMDPMSGLVAFETAGFLILVLLFWVGALVNFSERKKIYRFKKMVTE